MRKTMLRMLGALLLTLLLAGLAPTALAEGYYAPVEAKIPVGGTGTFHIREAGSTEILDTLDAEGTGEFTLSFVEPGNYAYEIWSEDEGNEFCYDVYVYVTTDVEKGTNALFTQLAIYEKGSDRKLPVAYYPIVMIDPPVSKRIIGDTPALESRFTFRFTAVSTTAAEYAGALPMPPESDGQSKTIEIVGAAEEEVGEIVFDRAGTYIYEVREVAGEDKSYTYDTTVYRLVVEIVEGETSLEDHQTMYKDGVAIDSTNFEFTNTYTQPLSPKTGDENNALLWTGVMAAALLAAGTAGFILVRKDRKGAEK